MAKKSKPLPWSEAGGFVGWIEFMMNMGGNFPLKFKKIKKWK